MSNQFMEAADAIRRVARLLDGFKLAADALEKVGSVAQATAEAAKAKDKIDAEAAKAAEKLAGLQAQAEQFLAESNEQLQSAKAEAIELVARANDEAAVIKAKALAESGEKAAALVSAAEGQVKAMKEQLTAGALELEQQGLILKDIDQSIKEKQKQVDSLTAALDKLRAKLI